MVITHNLKKFVLTLAGVFIVIVAVILNLDQLYLMAAVLFLIPSASYLMGRAMMRGLVCRRAALPACQEGERVNISLTVENVGRLPKLYLRVTDHLAASLEKVGDLPALILQLQPGSSANLQYTVEAKKRGAYQIGPTLISTTDPLGFYTQVQSVPLQTEMLVYPTVLPLRQLMTGSMWGQREMDGAPVRAGGLDFHGVRDYQPGDELRRVHWRTTARTGKLAVTEYAQGASSDVLLALDLNRAAYQNSGTGRESALEYAIKMAASVCDYLLRNGHRVQIVFPARDDQKTAELQALDNSSDMPLLLNLLARAEAEATETLGEALMHALPQARAGVLYITPDPQDPTLIRALAEHAAHGAFVFGYGLDRASFALHTKKFAPLTQKQERHTPQSFPSAFSSHLLWIKQGDDLAQSMEGGSYARR